MHRYVKACSFAAEKHKNQHRKDENKTPYINHPLQVAEILSECGVDDEIVLTSAVLHDTIEDTKTTMEELIDIFGVEIANIVQECSDDKLKSKVKRKQLQIEHASHVSDRAKLVKLADKYANLSDLFSRPPKSWSQTEINGYFAWAYAVCTQMKGVNKQLDDKLQVLFEKFGLSSLNESELEKYYKNIDQSE